MGCDPPFCNRVVKKIQGRSSSTFFLLKLIKVPRPQQQQQPQPRGSLHDLSALRPQVKTCFIETSFGWETSFRINPHLVHAVYVVERHEDPHDGELGSEAGVEGLEDHDPGQEDREEGHAGGEAAGLGGDAFLKTI